MFHSAELPPNFRFSSLKTILSQVLSKRGETHFKITKAINNFVVESGTRLLQSINYISNYYLNVVLIINC